MAKKKPSEDASSAVQRNYYFGAKAIEGATQNGALDAVWRLSKIGAANQVGMAFKPAHE